MLSNLFQYLKARDAAYKAIAASASDVYHGALYQISQSVILGVCIDNDAINDRATTLSRNTDAVGAGPWAPAIENASGLRGLLLRQP